MPFVYFGGKKGLARYYPPPAFPTIIEPFAGSAGYALHWAKPGSKVILVEKDPAVVGLWRRLQAPDARDDLLSIHCPDPGGSARDPLLALALALAVGGEAVGGRWKPLSTEPLLGIVAGGQGGQGAQGALQAASEGRPFTVTERMARDWRAHRNRIIRVLPLISDWQVIEGDYSDAPDVRATWFIDPPYWVPADARGTRGDGYRHGASAIDFDALAEWCKGRRGQTIVCEQDGATWLPFRPLRRMTTAAGDGGRRLEVVWTRTPGQMIATPAARKAKEAAKARRSARMRRSR